MPATANIVSFDTKFSEYDKVAYAKDPHMATHTLENLEELTRERENAERQSRGVLLQPNPRGKYIIQESGLEFQFSSSASVDNVGIHELLRKYVRKDVATLEEKKEFLQTWYGCVRAVEKEVFFARLIDPTGMTADVDSEIPIAYVEEDEIGKVEVGAVFYWKVVLLTDVHGRKTTTSSIRFRKHPLFAKYDQGLVDKYRVMFDKLDESSR